MAVPLFVHCSYAAQGQCHILLPEPNASVSFNVFISFVFSGLGILWKHSPGNHLSPSVIITYNKWKRAGHQSELPFGRKGPAEPGLERDVNVMLFLEYIHLQGPKGCPEGRRAYFIGMSICFIFYHTWHVSELISSSECGAVMIYENRGLLNFGLQNPNPWLGWTPPCWPSLVC